MKPEEDIRSLTRCSAAAAAFVAATSFVFFTHRRPIREPLVGEQNVSS